MGQKIKFVRQLFEVMQGLLCEDWDKKIKFQGGYKAKILSLDKKNKTN